MPQIYRILGRRRLRPSHPVLQANGTTTVKQKFLTFPHRALMLNGVRQGWFSAILAGVC